MSADENDQSVPGVNAGTQDAAVQMGIDTPTTWRLDLPSVQTKEYKPLLRSNASHHSALDRINELDQRLREQEAITTRIISLFDTIEKRFAGGDERAIKIASMFDTIHTRLTAAEKGVITNRDSIGVTDDLHDNLQKKVKLNTTWVQGAQKKLSFIEDENRRKILVLEGYPEEEGQNLRGVVDDLLTCLQVNFTSTAAESVYRRGRFIKPNPGSTRKIRPRPIIVVFSSNQFKQLIFQNVKNLRQVNQWFGVSRLG